MRHGMLESCSIRPILRMVNRWPRHVRQSGASSTGGWPV